VSLYDADFDLSEDENTPPPAPKSNLGSLKRTFYMLCSLYGLQFFCSSMFAYITSREIIFPERTAPKYIFDMAHMAITLVFMTIWI